METAEPIALKNLRLGIPRSSVYDYARREHDPLPSVKIGRHVRFVLLELVEWVGRQRPA